MKAIFLDIDGVIATPTSVRLNYLLGRGPERQWYDGIALSYVGRLVAETGAEVVLTSTWRADLNSENEFLKAIMDNLLEQLEEVGAPVSDATPRIYETDRSGEIASWLNEHPCEAYVVFDDLAGFEEHPEVAQHLVLIEESDGIRYQHYLKAREILGSKS